MTTVADTFDRADSTTPIGTASDGGTWTIFAGFFGISSNKAYLSSLQAVTAIGPANSFHSAIRDLGSATCDLSCDVFRSGTTGIGVLWFALDSATQHHGYYLQYKSDTSVLLQRWNASSGVTTLATWTVSAWTSSTKTLRVTYDSATGVITGYLAGTQIGTYTDATPETGTTVGFASTVDTTTSADTWDNFSASSVLPTNATASLSLSGSAAQSSVATAALALAGSGAGRAAGSASAAIALSAAAASAASGAASLTLAGTATWSEPATAALTLAAAGGWSEPAAAALTLTATNAGTLPATGGGSLALAGSAAARASAVAAGALALSGAATRSIISAGHLVLAGRAVWSRPGGPPGILQQRTVREVLDPYVIAGPKPQRMPLVPAFSVSGAFAGAYDISDELAAQLAVDLGANSRWVADPAKIIDNGDGTFSWHTSQGSPSRHWDWAAANAPAYDAGYAYLRRDGVTEVARPALIFSGDQWAQLNGGIESRATFTVIIVARLLGAFAAHYAGIVESLISGADPSTASDVFLRQNSDTLRSGVAGVKVIDTIEETGRPQIIAASHFTDNSFQLLLDENRSTKWFRHAAIAAYDLNWFLARTGGTYDPDKTMVMDLLDVSMFNTALSHDEVRDRVHTLNHVYGIL